MQGQPRPPCHVVANQVSSKKLKEVLPCKFQFLTSYTEEVKLKKELARCKQEAAYNGIQSRLLED